MRSGLCLARVRVTRVTRGFTLIELMMVLVIMGVLAGIVLASMNSPAAESREATLRAQLRILRSQVLFYKMEHGDNVPAADRLAEVLTQPTDVSGSLVPAGATTKGPYLSSFPANPYNGRHDVLAVPAGASVKANDLSGWLYQADGAGGFVLVANTTRLDRLGSPISEY